MLDDSRVWRCFVLDESGHQIGSNMNSRTVRQVGDPRLAPMAKSEGATWYHRPYFRRAIESPGELYISHPYLSVSDATMCVTVSMSLKVDGRTYVLCCDVADDSDALPDRRRERDYYGVDSSIAALPTRVSVAATNY